MAKPSPPNKDDKDPTQALRKLALRYPQAQQAIACQGTALESSSFKARNKAFLFIGGTDPRYTVRLKLSASQTEATRLAAKEPGRYKLGAHGWATLTFSAAEPPPRELLERWVDESYRTVTET